MCALRVGRSGSPKIKDVEESINAPRYKPKRRNNAMGKAMRDGYWKLNATHAVPRRTA